MIRHTISGVNVEGMTLAEILPLVDIEWGAFKQEVQSYMNVNAMVWGWKVPESDRDTLDLVSACVEHSPEFLRKHSGRVTAEALLQALREPPVPKAEVVAPTFSAAIPKNEKRNRKANDPYRSSDEPTWSSPVFYDSVDSGGGGFSD